MASLTCSIVSDAMDLVRSIPDNNESSTTDMFDSSSFLFSLIGFRNLLIDDANATFISTSPMEPLRYLFLKRIYNTFCCLNTI